MTPSIRCWLSLLSVILSSVVATAQVRLKKVAIQPPVNTQRWIDSVNSGSDREPLLVLMHFSSLPSPAEKAALLKQGIRLIEYIPDNTFTALVMPGLQTDKAVLKKSSGFTTFKPEWKAESSLWNKLDAQKGTTELLVTFYSFITAAEIKQFLAATGSQINASATEKYSIYKIVIAAEKVRGLASWYGVSNISIVTGMVPLDYQSRPAVKGNVAVASSIYGGYGLTGDSVTVGVGDNASGIYHIDLKERVTNFNPGSMKTHGEHVNGIVAGAGTVDQMGEGMAPHASLVDFLYDQIIPETGAMLHDYNMTITNNSYGVLLGDCDYSGTYDGYAHFLDTISLVYPEVLHVFASGNDGSMSCTPYLPGFATVGGGYQPAKNNVVVGSMTDFLAQASDESRGPTKDGRMKPEITAVGLGAYSTINIDDYEWSAGTSMAAPQASGGLAVLTQRYKQLNGGLSPRADVLKTVLLNGAIDLGNPGPDFSYGFGGMDIAQSLKMLDNSWYFTGNITNGASQASTINVPANTAQVKIMLCWHDVPASTAAATQLVNDLDLSVTDIGGNLHHPLVCDPYPANVNNNATERPDHLNNVEQVTITNPAAGTYTIKVDGYTVPSGPQRYVVAYNIIPRGTQLTYPLGGEQLSNVDSIRVFWNTVSTDSSFTAELSTNNGSSWTTISSAIPGTSRYVSFMPTGINSGNCLIRVHKNGTSETVTSGRFAISNVMNVTLDTAQCPTYVNIHWTPVPNASAYQLLSKKGLYMQVTDTTTDTAYSFGGMSMTEKSYVAVRPIINGMGGYRSRAVIRIAKDGACTGSASTGDLMAEKVNVLLAGRQHTSGELTGSESFTVILRNLYNVPCSNFLVTYNLNGSAWDTVATSATIPAHGATAVSQTGLDLSSPGDYKFTVAVQNLALPDPQHNNDTLRFTFKNIANDTLTLPFTDDFESMPKFAVTGHDSFGVSPNGHWDFTTNDSVGRMRSFVNEDITISGNRSVSLDENQAVVAGSNNKFTGTFNLGSYDTATSEVRLDFDYILHGTPKTASGNDVTFRAADFLAWQPFFTYDLNAYAGTLKKAISLSITDAVRAQNRNFSSSTQVAFGQNDTSLIAARNFGNGITIDNLKIYTVANDAQAVNVINPLPTNCGMATSQPLTIQVHNGVNYTLHNIQLFYREDGGAVHSGTLDSVTAKNTVNFTFPTLLDASEGVSHSIDIWLQAPGDTYLPNDSIIAYHFRNNKVVASFPFLENFENGDGGFYSDGINNSWQYGTPAAQAINKAASGKKAWKTNLYSKYNNLEQSYLYTPCFDISGLNHPTLSFSAALDIEDCGTVLCDKAYVEYSYDGTHWIKLGAAGSGTNWYDQAYNAWTRNNFTRWHVATTAIPKPVGGGSVITFRFALSSDPGATFEGFAVDDVHVYDLDNGILPANGTTIATATLSGNTWIPFLQSGQVIAQVQPQNNASGVTTATLYGQGVYHNPTLTQRTMPRSYTLSGPVPGDSIRLRIYLTDSELVNVLNDTTCMSCPLPDDAYRLGITQFTSTTHPSLQDNELTNDSAGTFTFTPYYKVQWAPFDKGYRAEFSTKSLSEIWLNDGGPTHAFSLGNDYLNFAAYRNGSQAEVLWTSFIDTSVLRYRIQRSADSINFIDILTVNALHNNPAVYHFNDSIGSRSSSDLYYRLQWTLLLGDTVYYSPVRKLPVNDSVSDIARFTAQMISKEAVLASWASYIDGVVHHYILERSIGNGTYTTLGSFTSARHFGQYYSYTDIPGNVPAGTLVHYRLTAVFDDGGSLALPEQVVEWNTPNTIGYIYPNPTTNGTFNFNWYANAGTPMQADLVDMQGKTVHMVNTQAQQWQNTTQVELPLLPKGMYLLRTIIGGKTITNKVVFE